MPVQSAHAVGAASAPEIHSRAGEGADQAVSRHVHGAPANEPVVHLGLTGAQHHQSHPRHQSHQSHPMARSIVAQLMQRCRVARTRLRKARREGRPERVVLWFEAKTEEAWDAAHCAKSMLQGRGPWSDPTPDGWGLTPGNWMEIDSGKQGSAPSSKAALN